MNFLSRLVSAGLVLATPVLSSCEPALENNFEEQRSELSVLRVGFPPTENPGEIIRKNKPLMRYLQQQIGVSKVQLSVAPSYTATIEDLRNHKLDLVYFGALTYVLAKNVINITPIVRGVVNGSTQNQAFIIANKDSGIHRLSELPGHSFAFGDVASTSGHLIPHQALLAEGINPHRDFDRLIYTGAHDKTALAVQKLEVDAGAMNARLFSIMIANGQLDKGKILVIWKSQSFADYPWAIRSDLDQKIIEAIQAAFLNLHDKDMLDTLGVDEFQSSSDADFEDIRRAAIKMGFMQENGSF